MKPIDLPPPGQIEVIERLMFDYVEKELPALWKVCYPRIYREPACGHYHSAKAPARQLATITIKIVQGTIGPSELYEFCMASHLARFQVPTYWVGQDLALALRKTRPPGEIDWFGMPMPFEAAVFMLPKGTLVHPTDGDVTFLAYCRLPVNVQYKSLLIPGKPYGSINGGLMLAAAVEKGYFLHWNIPLDAFNSPLTLKEICDLMAHFGDHEHEHATAVPVRGGGMTETDHALGADVAHFIFSTLTVMTARPDLITPAQLTKRVAAKKGGEVREFWNPHIIGEHYRIRREPAPSQGGTHASPRFHWVEGFVREQPFGPGRKLRKPI